WIAFGYLDKRWLSAAYLLGALAPMPLLVLAARVLEAGRAHPASWGSWLRELAPRRQAASVASESAPRVSANEASPSRQASPSSDASPSSEASPSSDASPSAEPARGLRRARFIRVTAGMLTALGLAYYFYGPPWYLNRAFGSLSIGFQEDLYLGNLQAISTGAI